MLQGTKAFCSGGDQALRTDDGYSDDGSFSNLNVLDLQVYWLSSDFSGWVNRSDPHYTS